LTSTVGLNVADVTNKATIGQDVFADGNGITVEAVIPAGHENDFIVWGMAAAGGKSSTSIAGSAGVQVVTFHTEASVAQGAHLTSAGAITINATNKLGVQNLAIAAAGSFSGSNPAVGGAVAVNVLPDVTTTAFVSSGLGHIARLDALGAITVSASSSIERVFPDTGISFLSFLPNVSSVAVAGGASGGGGAVVTGSDVREAARADVLSTGAKFLDLGDFGAAGADGYARALTDEERQAQQVALAAAIAGFAIVITTAQVPGRRPPLLVDAASLASMRAGSVVIDLASGELGGNVAGSVPDTTTVTGNGVIVVGAGNLPSAMPRTASTAYSRNITSLLAALLKDGRLALDLSDEIQAGVVITHDGGVVQPAVVARLASPTEGLQ